MELRSETEPSNTGHSQDTKVTSTPSKTGRSQESKVTSTPRMSPAYSLSPSISTIASKSDAADPGGHNSSDQEDVDFEDSLTNGSDDSSDKQADVKIKSSIKWKGMWKSLKPKNKQGLYHKIMSQPHESESIVCDLLSLYQRDPKSSITMILQFFIDVCGCQDLDIRSLYKFELDPSNPNIVTALENKLLQSNVKEVEYFLFMRRSKSLETVEVLISNFCEELIFTSFKRGILFDEVFSLHIFEFIKCMSFSSLKNIRTTGVLFSNKLLTNLLKSLSNLIIYINRNAQHSSIGEVDRRKKTLEKFIDFFCFIYDKNCLISDPRCEMIKIKCAEEVLTWIKLFPEIFIIKRKCIGHLMKTVTDQNYMVRLTALNTCEKLIGSRELYESMKKRIQLCLNIISKRILDVNYSIASKAVNIFTVAIELYCEFIIKEYKSLIVSKIYQKNSELAQSSANFLISFFRSQKKDETWILLSLVKLIFTKEEYYRRIPIFLEAMENYAYELEKFDLIIKILLNNQTDLFLRKCILQVATEKIRHYLTGNYSQIRDHELPKPDVQVPSKNHNKIATLFLPNLRKLVSEFPNDKTRRYIIEIVSFIDFQKCSEGLLTSYMDTTLLLFEDIFKISLDTVLLESICSVLYNLCAFDTGLEIRAKILVDNMTKKYSSVLIEDLNKLTATSEKELLIKIRETSMKVSILFSKFNLSNILPWNLIFLEFEKSTFFKVLKYLVVCCKYHLTWRLREIIATNDNNDGVQPLFYNNCKDFVFRSLILLNSKSVSSATFLVFENLHDFYITFDSTLRRHRNLQSVFIKVEDPEFQEVLIEFAVQHIIDNKNLSLDIRQKYLSNIIDLISIEVIPISFFSRILRYYHTHYEEFGPAMEYILSSLKMVNLSLPCIIMHTLVELYSQLLQKNQVVNMSSDGAIQLKLLSKKFARSKEFKQNSDALKLVLMAINFSFTCETHIPFLYFARYFVKLLKEEAKSEAYQVYTGIIPENYKDNDIVLIFGADLKPKSSD